MVKKYEENQDGNGHNVEKGQNRYQKPEQQSRGRTNNSFGRNQRGQPPRQQAGEQGEIAKGQVHTEAQGGSQGRSGQDGPDSNQPRGQFQPRNNAQGMRNQTERQEGAGPNRRYHERNERNREAGRNSQQRQHSGASGGRFGGAVKNRAEETIDDIKEDIARLEKEIKLEINEIKSLKL